MRQSGNLENQVLALAVSALTLSCPSILIRLLLCIQAGALVQSKKTALERTDFTPHLFMFVTAKKGGANFHDFLSLKFLSAVV